MPGDAKKKPEDIWQLREKDDLKPKKPIAETPKKPDPNAIKCRAAVMWQRNGRFSIEQVDVAGPKAGEVRVKMISAGICHTDLHIRDGYDTVWGFPGVLGHEGVGRIEKVGVGVSRVQPGDIVILLCEPYCGSCDFCKDERTNMCSHTAFNGLQYDGDSRIYCRGKKLYQMATISTFSEYTVTSQHNVTKVNLPAERAIMCIASCCLPTGYGAAVNVAKVTRGSSCAVWGLGGVGMCVLMGCRDSGASKIIGIDTNPRKFDLARKFGATKCIDPGKVKGVVEELLHVSSSGVDFCFVCVGSIPVMEEAFKSSHRHWGKTVVIGLSERWATMKVQVWDLLNGKRLMGTICGGYNTRLEIPQLVDKVKGEILKFNELISHRLPLDRIQEGFDLLGRGELLKAIIVFEEDEGISL